MNKRKQIGRLYKSEELDDFVDEELHDNNHKHNKNYLVKYSPYVLTLIILSCLAILSYAYYSINILKFRLSGIEDKNTNISPSIPTSNDIYDLRDVMLLSKSTTDDSVLKSFSRKWNIDFEIYQKCGITRSRNYKPIENKDMNNYNIAIISSWAPRPCGIATHSGKLVEGIKKISNKNFNIDVFAVNSEKERHIVYPPIVKYVFDQYNSTTYEILANHIVMGNYDMLIIGYEFGLYGDELLLCAIKNILAKSKTTVYTILHTLADDLPWQKQALTQQVQ
jgi:hypothetical protein